MTIKKRLKSIEEQRLVGDEKVHLDEIPEGATLQEAQRIYDSNLRKLNDHARRYPSKLQEEDACETMTLAEATKIFEDNLKSLHAGELVK